MIMNTTIRKFTYFLTACLLGCLTGHAYEQDNWYLDKEWIVPNGNGVAYHQDQNTFEERVYVVESRWNDGKVKIFDLNGTLVDTITGLGHPYDLAVDHNGSIFIAAPNKISSFDKNGTLKWRLGKEPTTGNGTSGTGNGEFSSASGIAVSQGGEIYIADQGNHRIQVLDHNGTFKSKFGSYGFAPGQLYYPKDLVFLNDGTLVVGDRNYFHYFRPDGTLVKRVNTDSARGHLSIAQDGTLFSSSKFRNSDGTAISLLPIFDDARTCFTSQGDLVANDNSSNSERKIQIWKRAYRTKGLPQRNVIPQPRIHKIAQRSVTNVLDLDFEIIDSDDTNATVGILAYAENERVVPQAWTDGTGSKIGTPIATNQVHRVSWDVKQDWNSSTGSIKFEILCQDGRTNKPVDLHFLTLPFSDGNLTISRSPLKDSDFISYAKYLLAKGDAHFESSSNAVTY